MIGDDDEDAWLEVIVDTTILAEGTAADTADDKNKRLEGLPRILRYVLLARRMIDVTCRLVADINELRPGLMEVKAWALARNETTGLALAAELDRLEVMDDLSMLRSPADRVRLLSLTRPYHAGQFVSCRRVTRALVIAFDQVATDLDDERCLEFEQVVYGFAALPTASGQDLTDSPRPLGRAPSTASWIAISHRSRAVRRLAQSRLSACLPGKAVPSAIY